MLPEPRDRASDATANWLELFRRRAETRGTERVLSFLPAAGEAEETLDYAELDRRARAIAAAIQQGGDVAGERGVLLYPPGLEYVAAFAACVYAGVVAVPSYPPDPMRLARTAARLDAILDDAEPSIILTQQSLIPLRSQLGAQAQATRWLATDGVDHSEADRWRPPALDGESHLLLQYTSGSTGRPRGVVLTHTNLLHNSEVIRRNFAHDADSQGVIWLPPYHDMGLIGGILQPLYVGFPTTLMSPFTFLERPLTWLETISRVGGTTSGGPNFAFALATRRITESEIATLDLSNWSVAFCGSEPIRPETMERFIEAFEPCGFRPEAFYPCYGLAESTLMVTGNRALEGQRVLWVDQGGLEAGRIRETGRPSRGATGLVACGVTAPNSSLAIVHPETRARCAEDEVGEIWLAGPSVAQGYWNAPLETAETFGAEIRGEEGPAHLRTGDLGFVSSGQLFVTGRIKDLIIVRGRNLAPQDLEVSVASAHPSIRRGCVAAVGLDGPDGKDLAIVAEVREDVPAEWGDVAAAIRSALASQHDVAPVAIELIRARSQPKTTSGKLQRSLSAEMLRRGEHDTLHAWRAPRADGAAEGATAVSEAEALALFERVTGISPSSRDARERPLVELGLDSLSALELRDAIRDRMQLDVPLRQILGAGSLRDLVAGLDGAPQRSELPRCSIDRAARGAPFPLREIQQAYWIGRTDMVELGSVACHTYLEIDAEPLDVDRLRAAWRVLIERHDMLRGIVTPDGTQRILEATPPFEIREHFLQSASETERADTLATLRERLAHEVRPADAWPPFEVVVSHLPDHDRVHLSIDLLFVDAHSLYLLGRELEQLYRDPATELVPLDLSYRDYVLYELASRSTDESDPRYWTERAAALPPPPLLPPPPRSSQGEAPASFTRRTLRVDVETWSRLRDRARSLGLTSTGLLLAIYAEVVGAWSRDPHFSLIFTCSERERVHPQVDALVGDFTRTILLEVDQREADAFASRAAAVQRRLHADMDRSATAAADVVRRRAEATGDAGAFTRNVVFTSLLGEPDRHPLAWLGPVSWSVSQTPQVLLDCQVCEESGELVVHWDARDGAVPETCLDPMFRAFERLLRELAASQTQAGLPAHPVLLREEVDLRLAVNATAGQLPDGPLWEPFALRAKAEPDRLAVVSGDRRLSYGELLARSQALAEQLVGHDVRPNQLVAVLMRKGWEQVVATLGVLQAGAAYLPIDPAFPERRIRHLIEHGGARVVLTQAQTQADWQERLPRERDGVVLSVGDEGPTRPSPRFQPVAAAPDDLAYVIYTSGSTGEPKGVMIDHRGALNTVLDVNRRFDLTESDRVLGVSSLTFDLSVFDVFGALSAGAALVLPRGTSVRDPSEWARLVEEHAVTVWNSVPALLELLLETVEAGPTPTLDSLRLVMLSGDWIPLSLPERARRGTGGAEIVSLGGATEASIWSIFFPVAEIDPKWASIPYGRPLTNQRIHVLDAHLAQRPTGVPGEIHIGGVGLAKGYWRAEEQTRRSFVHHPASGERLYRTGDLGRYLPDGCVEFLGRRDSQVKINGFRIEITEIEAVLSRHPDVQSAAVAVLGEQGAGRRLAAMLVPTDPDASDPEKLRRYVADRLPSYMVPSQLSFAPALPLSANGKVNRAAVSEQLTAAFEQPRARAPHAMRPGRVLALAREVLELPSLDLGAGFAAVGATSLQMLRLANRLVEEFGTRPSLDEFHALESVSDLAAFYDARVPHPATGLARDARARATIVEPEARERFRREQRGLRREVPGERTEGRVELAGLGKPLARSRRESCRHFAAEPVALESLAQLLRALAREPRDEGEPPKYRYASAGGLYPVQVYLDVRRVFGLEAGRFYYDPSGHALRPLAQAPAVPSEAHWPVNRRMTEEAAFGLYLVADLAAMQPIYAEKTGEFCLLEAGGISQLLYSAAADLGLGICQVAGFEHSALVEPFALSPSHEPLCALVGGIPGTGDPEPARLRDASFRARPTSTRDPGVAVSVEQLRDLAELPGSIDPASARPPTGAPPSGILLTGATGFVGSLLLRELLERTDATVHCLVRPGSGDGGDRVRAALEDGNAWSDAYGERIRVLAGDLGRPRLGLESRTYTALAHEVQSIYHSGAAMSWVSPYARLAEANVGGTRALLELACSGVLKTFHHVSSLAVFPFSGCSYVEGHPLDHGEALFGGYAQSKWVAERLVAIATGRGLPTTVLRPALVSGDSVSGRFNPHSFLDRMIKGSVQLGAAPDLSHLVDIVPVDYVAKAYVHLSLDDAAIGRVFHSTNPVPLTLDLLLEFMIERGFTLDRLDFEDWRRRLFDHPDFQSNALYVFGPFLSGLAQTESIMSRGIAENTVELLEGSGIACPPADRRLLETYFDYYAQSGFL